MILRSSLIRRREDVSVAEFSTHFRDVQGPLAAKLPNAVAYTQNHRVRRWDLPEATFLPRVDAYSQIWFRDLHSMIEAMRSPQQQLAYADFTRISDAHTVTVQDPGPSLGHGERGATKLALVLAGAPESAATAEVALFRFLDLQLGGDFVLRVNRIIRTDYATSTDPELGALAEIWLPTDHRAEAMLNAGLLQHVGELRTAIAMLVTEVVLVPGPEGA